MSKSHTCKVTRAFVHEGKIRSPGASINLSDSEAKPLLEAGKVILAPADDAPGKEKAKAKAKADADAGGKAGAGGKAEKD